MGINRVSEFISSITAQNAKAQAVREVEYLRTELSQSSNHELSLHSLKRAFSRYRHAVKSASFEPDIKAEILSVFTLSAQEKTQIASDSRASVAHDQLTQGEKKIDPELLIAKAESLLESKSYLKLVAGLAFLTGRRPTELLKSGNFHFANQTQEAIDCVKKTPSIALRKNPRIASESDIQEYIRTISSDGSAEYLLFSGQLKQADSADSALQPFPIPVLSNPEKIMDAINKLRAMKPEFQTLENDVIHSKCNSELGKVIKNKAVYSTLLPAQKCSPKALRSAYAESCYYYFVPGQDFGKAIYFSRILGHSANSTSTSQSYMDFVIA